MVPGIAVAERLDSPAAVEPVLVTRRPLRGRRLPPGWPLLGLLYGYPITWALGFGPFIVFVVAIPMAWELAKRRPLVVPRMVRVFLLFLLVVAASAVMLKGQPPGAIKSHLSGQILAYTYRGAAWVSGLIAGLYVLNLSERELPSRRLAKAMGGLFVLATVLGYWGLFSPYGQFTSPIEMLVQSGPHIIAKNQFIHDLIHPASSEVQRFLGFTEARPKAPFEYTNEWGGNISLLLPFYLISWLRSPSARMRRWGWIPLVVAVPPIIYSLNRGLWVALVIVIVLFAVHLLRLGKVMTVMAALGAMAVGVAIFLLSPLYTLTLDRVHHPHSNAGRSFVYQLAYQGAEASPLLGWGGPRSTAGSDQSIARGVSAKCQSCGGVPIGTHGTVWYIMFSAGFFALALLAWFLIGSFIKALRRKDDFSAAATASLAVFMFEAFIYNQLPMAFLLLMCAVGLSWRVQLAERRDDALTRPGPKALWVRSGSTSFPNNEAWQQAAAERHIPTPRELPWKVQGP
jgi:hypothetical protein